MAESYLKILARHRQLFPTPMNKVQNGQLLNDSVFEYRKQPDAKRLVLLGKKSGNNCPQPRTGTKISCDYVVDEDTKWGWDVITDAEGAGKVRTSWGTGESMASKIADGSRTLVPAVEPITTQPPPPDPPPPDPPPPDPPPPDPPPPPPPSDVEIRLRALELQVDDLEDRLTMLASRPYPTYRGSLFGIPITSHPVE